MKPGTLSIVSTPIGNPEDITLRAIKSLINADFIICEELKEGRKLFSFFNIEKEIIRLNEHNSFDELLLDDICIKLSEGKNISMISDCGTPAFADPGIELIRKAVDLNIPVNFIPGANSVISAIVLSGFDTSRFYFAGFVSPKKDLRKLEFRKLSVIKRPVILMETPYRLNKLLYELHEHFNDRRIFIGINLTMNNERHLRGFTSEIISLIGHEKIKEEFVVVIEGYGN